MSAPGKRCATVAIIGAPNAGKSTLLNCLVGQKISIVTPKVQTTRTRVKGIIVQDGAQIVFIDTPGIFSAKKNMQRAMVKEAWGSIKSANFIVLMIDAKKGIREEEESIIAELKRANITPIIVLNKIDRLQKPQLLPLIERINQEINNKEIFMISALKSDGTEDFKNYLVKNSPEGEWEYPEDQVTDVPMKILAAEFSREKLFLKLQQELPYGIMVETEKWEEKKNEIRVHQVIYVLREGHKAIVVGKGGSLIKQVGEETRKGLEKMLGKKVHLFLHVKHKEKWDESWVPGDGN